MTDWVSQVADEYAKESSAPLGSSEPVEEPEGDWASGILPPPSTPPVVPAARRGRANPALIDEVASEFTSEQEDAQISALHQARAVAATVDPDRAARAAQLAEAAGVSMATALRDTDKIEKELDAAGFDGAKLAKENPLLAAFLTSPTNMAVVGNDLENVHGVMRLFAPQPKKEDLGFWDLMASGLTEGSLQAERGRIGVKAQLGLATPADMDRVAEIDRLSASVSQDAEGRALPARALRGASAQLQRMGTAIVAGKTGALVGGAVSGPAAPVGAAVGGTVASFGSFFTEIQGNRFLDLKAKGYTDEQAMFWASLSATGEAALEELQFARYLKPVGKGLRALRGVSKTDEILKAGGSAVLKAGKYAATTPFFEGATEGLQSVNEQLTERVAAKVHGKEDPGFSWGQVLAEAQGGFETSLLLGMPGVAGEYVSAQKQIAISEKRKEFFTALSDASKRSEAIQRMPEKMAQVIQQAAEQGEMPEFYVDVAAWNKTWEAAGHDPRQAYADLVGNTEGYDAAVREQQQAGKADVAIPSGIYATKIAPSALASELAKNTRLHADDITEAEAEELKKEVAERKAEIDAEIGREVTRMEEANSKAKVGDKVFGDPEAEAWAQPIIEQAIEAGMSPTVARKQLIPLVAFGLSMSRRAGKSFAGVMSKYSVTVEDGELVLQSQPAGPGASTLDQSAYAAVPGGELRGGRFSTDFVGEGWGGQAYGWGLYYGARAEDAKMYIRGPQTKIFEADIPEDEELLNWESPISEQSPKVAEALKRIPALRPDELGNMGVAQGANLYEQAVNGRWTGKMLYQRLTWADAARRERSGMTKSPTAGPDRAPGTYIDRDTSEAASRRLGLAGIPGHVHFDLAPGDEMGGEMRKNYLIWDDSRIKALGKIELDDAVSKMPSAAEVMQDILFMLDPQGKALADRIAQSLSRENGPEVDDEVALPATLSQVQNLPEWKQKITAWMRENGRTQQEIDEYIAGVTGQMKIFAALGPIELELLPRGAGLAGEEGPIRENADFIYKISFDASAMCVRRLEAAATASYIQSKLNRALTVSERKALVAMFRQAGKLAPCLYCYVESPRDKASEFVGTAADVVFGKQDVPAGWKGGTLEALTAALTEVRSKGLDASAVDANILLDPEYAELPESKAKVEAAPDLYAYLRTVMLAAKANLPKVYEEYNGQILDIPQAIIQELNGYAGFRIFSTSDFQAEHVADLMQLFSDLALVGGKSHAYTKTTEFVEIFGETGAKIQTSIFARVNRITGEIEPDTQQGMSWEDARKYRKRYANVGPVMVASTDEVVLWSMEQDWIDYIIPFHYSGLEERFFAAAGYSDFTSTQTEKHLRKVEVKQTKKATKKTATSKAEKAEYSVLVDGVVRSKHSSLAAAEQAAKPRVRMHQMDTAGGISDAVMTRRYLEICLSERLVPVFPAFMFKDFKPTKGLTGDALKEQRSAETKAAVERWKAMIEAGEIDWSQINMNFAKLKKDYARTDTPFEVSKPEFNERKADEALKAFLRGETPTATSDTVIGDSLIDMIERNEKLAEPLDLGAEMIARVEEELDRKSAEARAKARPGLKVFGQSLREDTEEEIEAAERELAKVEAEGDKGHGSSLMERAKLSAVRGLRRDISMKLEELRAGKYRQDDTERRGEVELGDRSFKIRLFKARDLSTMLHEESHIMLEIFGDLAEEADASAEIREDYAKLLAWFGVKDRSEIRTKHHEKFAYAMEQYLMEGKAPSPELEGFFARVKEWMKSVYREIKRLDDLYRTQFGEGIELTGEVRGVFDRMLAADRDVQNAEGVNFYIPLFAAAAEVGWTPEQLDEYRRKGDEATKDAIKEQERALLEDIKVQQAEGYADALAEMERTVEAELNQQPIYHAIYALTAATKPDGSQLDDPALSTKISYKSLIELVGGPRAEALRRKYKFAVVKKGGADVAELADTFQFRSADEFVEALEQTPDRDAAVKAEAKRRMEERNGSLMKDVRRRQARALEATHTTSRAKFLGTELDKLAELAGQKKTPGWRVISEWAKLHISTIRIRDIRPDAYLRAEVAAAKRAMQMVRKGNWAAAYQQKRQQLAYFFLYREALKAQQRAEKNRDFLTSRMSRRLRASVGLAGKNFLDQLDTILEAVDLKRRPVRSDKARPEIGPAPPDDLSSRQSLQEWVAEQIAEGRDPVIPPFLMDAAFQKNWRDMTMNELEAVRDAVTNVIFLARKKLGIDIAGKQAEWSRTHAGLLYSLRSNFKDTGRMKIDPTLREGTLAAATSSFREDSLKIEELISRLDGRDPNGIWAQIFIHPFSDAEAFEREVQAEVTAKIVQQLAVMPAAAKKRFYSDKKYYIKSIDQHLTMRAIYAVAANTGNESNLRKMLQGYQTEFGSNVPWTEDTIREILDTLTTEDMDFIQTIWDALETMWPKIEAMERRLNGLPPKQVKALGFTFKGKQYRGGYYPLMYDPARSKQGKVASEEAALGMQFGPRAMTLHGHTIDRIEKFSAPVFLDLDQLPMHIMRVAHDLAYREALIAAGKVLNDREIWTELNRLAGSGNAQLLYDHLKYMANPYAAAPNAAKLEKLVGWAASRTTLMALGFNIGVALNNFANVANSTEIMKQIDPKSGGTWFLKGFKDFWTQPRRMFAYVNEKSSEMANRRDSVNDGLRAELDKLKTKHGKVAELQKAAYHLSAWTDVLSSYPLWIAAYRHSLSVGKNEEESIRAGDAAVRQALGAGGLKDQTKITRSGVMRLLAPFMSFLNVMANRQRAILWDAKQAKDEGDLFAALPALVVRQLMLSIIAPTMATLAAGRWAGKDDDDEGWMAWLFLTVVGGTLGSVPVLRDIANSAATGRAPSAAIYRTFDVLGDAIVDPVRALQGEASVEKAVRSAALGVGTVVGVPTNQLSITGGYLMDLAAGEDEFESWGDMRWMIYRRPRSDR